MSQKLQLITFVNIACGRNLFKVFRCINYSLNQYRYLCSSPSESGGKEAVNIRYNFHKELEDALNKQINLELQASYTYYCMSICLSRPDVALPGYARFFAAASAEERHHADLLSTFVNTCGGTVKLSDVPAPVHGPFHDPVKTLVHSIELERNVLKSIEDLHKIASTHGHTYLLDFLETNFIPEGYEGIKLLAEMLTNLQRAGSGVGVVLLDLDLLRHPPTMHSTGGK